MSAVSTEASAPALGGRLPRPARRSPRRLLAVVLPPVAFAVVVLGAWQAYCALSGIDEITLPAPSDVASALWGDRHLLVTNAGTTILEIVVGFAAAVLLGLGLAVLIHSSRAIERAVYPWLVVSQMVPIPAIAPIFVIWTGFDIRPKVMVIALVSFFPIAVNAIDGLRAAEGEQLDLMRTLGASRRQLLTVVRLPAALPFVFSGLKIAAAFSVIGAVFGEWVGSDKGLGSLILTDNNQSATASLFAVVVVLAVIGIAFFALIGVIERLALPWYFADRKRS